MPNGKQYVTTSKADLLIQDWATFWCARWSVLLLWDKITKISPYTLISKMKFQKDEKLNLYFTINGYQKKQNSEFPKDRSEANVNQLNCFYFDIDLKETMNKWVTKIEAFRKLQEHQDQFDIIVESRGGFHCYVLIDPILYPISLKDKYLEDWKQMSKELSSTIGLEFDPLFDLTRISRIPGTYHQKPGDTDYFELVVHKGLELISLKYKRMTKINSVPIEKVLDVLGIKYTWVFLYEDGMVTSGRKIFKEENKIKEFSFKGRPVGRPFDFVIMRFQKHEGKTLTEAKRKVYRFFEENFSIISVDLDKKTIEIPRLAELFLATDKNLNSRAIEIALTLFWFAKNSVWSEYIWKCFNAKVSDIFLLNQRKINISDQISLIKKNIQFLNAARVKIRKWYTPLMKLSIHKLKGERFMEFHLLPFWKAHSELDSKHYVNCKIFDLSISWNQIKFYLYICSKLINVNAIDELVLTKKQVLDLLQNTNITRSMVMINTIQSITQDFRIEKTQKEVIFRKGKEKPLIVENL